GGQQRHRVPASAHPPGEQPGEQLAKACPSRDEACQQQACEGGASVQRCDLEREQPRALRTAAWNTARSDDYDQDDTPGDGEREGVVGQHRVPLNERLKRCMLQCSHGFDLLNSLLSKKQNIFCLQHKLDGTHRHHKMPLQHHKTVPHLFGLDPASGHCSY
ncbi:MAG TPA: hypothetical protein VEI53_09125, partial [Ktedonobacteraceae bacterium]|nr:hypothetical protein [Ktedonobacteraceae bacterium]